MGEGYGRGAKGASHSENFNQLDLKRVETGLPHVIQERLNNDDATIRNEVGQTSDEEQSEDADTNSISEYTLL